MIHTHVECTHYDNESCSAYLCKKYFPWYVKPHRLQLGETFPNPVKMKIQNKINLGCCLFIIIPMIIITIINTIVICSFDE